MDAATTKIASPPLAASSVDTRSPWRLAAYAGPSIPISALAIPLLAYIPTLYATRIGLSLAAIGAIFLVVRLVDIGLDPLIGAIMDRGQSRFGRFRPWLAGGAVPLMAGVLLLFNPPQGAGTLYLALCLALTYAAYSACYLAHLSWGSTLSSDYSARSRVFAWWQSGMLLGSIIILATPILLEGTLGFAHDDAVASMGWLIAILLPVTVIAALLFVAEPPAGRQHSEARIIDYLKLMARPTIARLLIADLVIGTAIGMNSALFFFYFGVVKGASPLEITILLFLNLCGSLCGAPIWSMLTTRIGKHRAAAWAFSLYALSLIVIALMPANIVLGSVILFLAGLTLSAGPMLLRSMMADAGDEEYLRSGYDRTGLLSALFSGTNKLGLAMAPGLTFLGLGAVGFQPAGTNGAGAINMLIALYIVTPALLGLLTAWVISAHKLTAEKHADICAMLDQLRTA